MGTSVAEELSQVFEIHGDHRELDSHLPILLSSLEPRQGSDDIARELDRSHGFHSGKKRMPARSRLVGHLSVSFSSVTAALFLVPFRPYSILSIRPAPRATLVYDSRSPREDFSLVAQHAELQRIVESLRRQRVRQGDLKPVLEFLIAQADCVAKLGGTASSYSPRNQVQSAGVASCAFVRPQIRCRRPDNGIDRAPRGGTAAITCLLRYRIAFSG